MIRSKGKVAVAMSGGVDSSVAAHLLIKEGYDVVGFTMKKAATSEEDGKKEGSEVEEAAKVCRFLGIEHFGIDVTEIMEERVIMPFIQEYLAGRTPNPCVECNRFIKFGSLIEEISRRGFDFMATGHYARVGEKGGQPILLKGKDKTKDQSYFLHAISRDHLARILLPLGNYTKVQIKKWAKEISLPVADRPESQDICFIPDGGYGEFLKTRGFKIEPGDFVKRDGQIIGRHQGSLLYTIGQRARLGGIRGGRLYVTGVDPKRNLVMVGSKEELLSRELIADRVNLLVEALPLRCEAKIRYAHRPATCRVRLEEEILNVTFDTPQEAITPGQYVVLYEGEVVLGGGRIITRGRQVI